jgi:G3E family GTPase
VATVPAIRLTVIGGYLGAGKTTLLNHVLRDAGDRRLAVLVNDFGSINIDAELVASRDGEMLSLTNGCICCGIGGDFIAALASLRDVDDPPEQVVVEASGVADPAQIAVLGDMPGYVRDAVVVVADAETVRARAEDEHSGHQVRSQLRAADLLVVNKTDLVEPSALEPLRAWLRETVGPSTGIVDAAFGNVPTDVLIGARDDAGEPPRTRAHAAHDPADHDHAGHDHGGHGHYDSWSWSGDEPLSGAGLVEALPGLPEGVVRAKGILLLREDPSQRYVLQLVGRRYSIEAQRPWGEESPASRVVVIGLPGSVDAQALDATFAGLAAATMG